MFEILAVLLACTAVCLLYLTNKYQYLIQKPAHKKYRVWAYSLIGLTILSLLFTMSLVASLFSTLVVLMLIAAILPFCTLLFKGVENESSSQL